MQWKFEPPKPIKANHCNRLDTRPLNFCPFHSACTHRSHLSRQWFSSICLYISTLTLNPNVESHPPVEKRKMPCIRAFDIMPTLCQASKTTFPRQIRLYRLLFQRRSSLIQTNHITHTHLYKYMCIYACGEPVSYTVYMRRIYFNNFDCKGAFGSKPLPAYNRNLNSIQLPIMWQSRRNKIERESPYAALHAISLNIIEHRDLHLENHLNCFRMHTYKSWALILL